MFADFEPKVYPVTVSASSWSTRKQFNICSTQCTQKPLRNNIVTFKLVRSPDISSNLQATDWPCSNWLLGLLTPGCHFKMWSPISGKTKLNRNIQPPLYGECTSCVWFITKLYHDWFWGHSRGRVDSMMHLKPRGDGFNPHSGQKLFLNFPCHFSFFSLYVVCLRHVTMYFERK